MTFSLLYCFFVIGQRPKLSEWKYQLRSFIVRQDFGQRQRIAANLSAQLRTHFEDVTAEKARDQVRAMLRTCGTEASFAAFVRARAKSAS